MTTEAMSGRLVTDGVMLRAAEDNKRTVWFRANTPTLDSHRTKIEPMGLETKRFSNNPIFLWAHDGYGSVFGGGPELENVIGRVINYERSENAFDIEVEFATSEVNPKAEQALRLVRAGFLNAVSIGFRPLEWVEERTEAEGNYYRITKAELLEVSLVPIPSNPDALKLTRDIFSALEHGRSAPEPFEPPKTVSAPAIVRIDETTFNLDLSNPNAMDELRDLMRARMGSDDPATSSTPTTPDTSGASPVDETADREASGETDLQSVLQYFRLSNALRSAVNPQGDN